MANGHLATIQKEQRWAGVPTNDSHAVSLQQPHAQATKQRKPTASPWLKDRGNHSSHKFQSQYFSQNVFLYYLHFQILFRPTFKYVFDIYCNTFRKCIWVPVFQLSLLCIPVFLFRSTFLCISDHSCWQWWGEGLRPLDCQCWSWPWISTPCNSMHPAHGSDAE